MHCIRPYFYEPTPLKIDPLATPLKPTDVTLAYGDRAVPRLLDLLNETDAPYPTKCEAAELLFSVLSDPTRITTETPAALMKTAISVLQPASRGDEEPSSLLFFVLKCFLATLSNQHSVTAVFKSLTQGLPLSEDPFVLKQPTQELMYDPRALLAEPLGALALEEVLRSASFNKIARPAALDVYRAIVDAGFEEILVRLRAAPILLSIDDETQGFLNSFASVSAAVTRTQAGVHSFAPYETSIPRLMKAVEKKHSKTDALIALSHLVVYPAAAYSLSGMPLDICKIVMVINSRIATTGQRIAAVQVLYGMSMQVHGQAALLPHIDLLAEIAETEIDNDEHLFAELLEFLKNCLKFPDSYEFIEEKLLKSPRLYKRLFPSE